MQESSTETSNFGRANNGSFQWWML